MERPKPINQNKATKETQFLLLHGDGKIFTAKTIRGLFPQAIQIRKKQHQIYFPRLSQGGFYKEMHKTK